MYRLAERKNDAFKFSLPKKEILIKYGELCLVGFCDKYETKVKRHKHILNVWIATKMLLDTIYIKCICLRVKLSSNVHTTVILYS